MSKKERIKTEIDVLKALILAFLTAIFGVCGFAFINYQKINIFQGIVIAVGILSLFCILYILLKRVIKNLNQLEEIE